MKKFILSVIVMIFIANCGGGSTSTVDDNQSSTSDDTTNQIPNEYPTSNDSVDTNSESNDSTIIDDSSVDVNNTTTPLTSSSVISKALINAGYNLEFITLANTRGNVDYSNYLYLTSQNSTVALLWQYVYGLQNANGQRILFTIDGPSDFDTLEKSSDLVLRANFTSNSALRYALNFAPTGFVNLNTTKTNPNATIATLLNQLHYAFNQFTLTNPTLTKESLSYQADSKGDSTYILCNNVQVPLDPTQTMIDLSAYLDNQTLIHCRTKNAVLIGSIRDSNITGQVETSTISGDLYQSISLTSPQVEGKLYTNKESVSFISNELSGNYGMFSIKANGEWLYSIEKNSSNLTNIDFTQSIKDSFTITTTDGATANVEITLVPISVDVGEITEGMLYIKGEIFSANSGESIDARNLQGNYGTLDLLTDGSWKYSLDNNLSQVKALVHGETLIDTFNINNNIDIEITILGQNTIILGTVYKEVIEDVAIDAIGSIYIEYSDNASFKPQSIQAKYGNFTLDSNGQWSYKLNTLLDVIKRLNDNDKLEETFTIETTDGVSHEIHVGIIGADPLILGDTLRLINKSDHSTDGKLYVERGVNAFITQNSNGKYGLFNLSLNGDWYYITDLNNTAVENLDANDVLEESFIISTLNGATKELKIEIRGNNSPLTILNKGTFDNLPTFVQSLNNQDADINFTKLDVTGDNPKVTYQLNNEVVNVDSLVMLKGGQDNIIEVIIEELGGDFEQLTLSKIIKVEDTLPPKPPLVDHKISTTENQEIVLVTAYEDNVSLYVDGTFIDTIIDSTNQQSVTLDTSGASGIKTFKFTLKDAQGNESGEIRVEIQKLSANSPTDFSDVTTHMLNSTTGSLEGSFIDDAEGISQVKITYDINGTTNENNYSTGDITTAPAYPYGTLYNIEVRDGAGVLSTNSRLIEPYEEPSNFSDLTLMHGAGYADIYGSIDDINGILLVKVFHDENESTNYTYTGDENITFSDSTIMYDTTVKIAVTDKLDNTVTHTIEVKNPETDFSNVLINDNNDSTSYLLGGVRDNDGINTVEIYYNTETTPTHILTGNGNVNVGLDNIPPQPTGTPFTIKVQDSLANTTEHTGILDDI